MRALPLAALVALAALSGCIVVEQRPPPPAPAAAPPPVRPAISREQAVDIVFDVARGRGLDVDRVHHVSYDASGRWHVDLRGRKDRAKAVLDARDGRILKLETKDE